MPGDGRIGPNAITRVAEVMTARAGQGATQALFEQAGLARHLAAPPQHMVDEADVRALHAALRQRLGPTAAREVARAAGERTAEYLLARRIPRPVQALLKRLPAPLAARVLLAAIRRNAWTFAGSGDFEARAGAPCVLTIRRNPLCVDVHEDTPGCEFYAGTFERLFVTLVHPDTRVHEVCCERCGGDACRFELAWRRSADAFARPSGHTA